MANRRVLKYDRCCKRCGVTPIYGSKYCDECKGRKSEGWDKGKPRLCNECGTEYAAKHPTSLYCSRACQARASKDRRASQPHTHTCKGCGKTYTPRRADAHSYCSRECAFKHASDWVVGRPAKEKEPEWWVVYFPECAHCGERFAARNKRAKYCSKACSRDDNTAWSPDLVRVCKGCGKTFHPSCSPGPIEKHCSRACMRRANKTPGNPRKRARKYGAEYERVIPKKVFERDGWRCQICGKDTPRNHRGTQWSNAPELDHRIPISRGGDHLYSNVQCACRACNREKGNRSEVGQLPLTMAHSAP